MVEDATGKLPDYVKPYIIKQVGALKVGIIGLAYPGSAAIVKAESVKGLTFLDGVETVSKLLPEVRPQVDLLVVLSHLSFTGDQDLAARVKGIDVIVGGHSHTEQRYTMKVGETLIVQAGTGGKVLGRLEVDYDRAAKKIVKYTGANELVDVVSGKIAPNAQVAALVKTAAGRGQRHHEPAHRRDQDRPGAGHRGRVPPGQPGGRCHAGGQGRRQARRGLHAQQLGPARAHPRRAHHLRAALPGPALRQRGDRHRHQRPGPAGDPGAHRGRAAAATWWWPA